MPVSTPFADRLPDIIQLPELQPDFSSIQNVAMRANSIFEQGLNQVKNDYSSVLNADVTGPEMEQRKQQYINSFQDGLKKVTPRDLRMPQDVLQAENLLQPFWSDKALIKNMYRTKEFKGTINKVQQGLMSKDDKERDMYNPAQIEDQQIGLEELANAGTDEQKIDRIHSRTLAPFYNITKTLQDYADKDKLKIVYASGTGTPYLVSTQGGNVTVPNFDTWARGHMGPEMQGMFNTLGRVAAYKAKQKVLQENPGITEDQVNGHIASDAYNYMNDYYTKNIAKYGTAVEQLDAQIKELKSKGHVDQNGELIPTDQQYPKWQLLVAQKQNHEEWLKGMQNEYLTFNLPVNKQSMLDKYTQDPVEAFANQAKDGSIQNWSVGQAAHVEQEIKPNSAFSDAMTNQREYYRINTEAAIQRQKNQIEGFKARGDIANEGLDYDKNGNPIRGTDWYLKNISTNTGTGNGQVSLSQSASSGIPQEDITSPLKVPNAYENYVNNTVTQPAKDAMSDLFSVNGAASTLEGTHITFGGKSDTLTARDIDVANRAIQQKFSDAEYHYNPQETISLGKLAIAVGAKNMDPETIKVALESKLGQVEYNKSGDPDIVSVNRASLIARAEDKVQQSNAAQKRINDAVQHSILSDPEKNKQIIVNGQLATPEKMAPDFLSVQLGDNNGKIIKNLTPVEFAKLHKENGYELIGQNVLRVKGTNYTIVGVNGKLNDVMGWSVPAGVALDRFLREHIVPRYGDATTFNSKLSEARNKIIESLPAKDVATGLAGFGSMYNADIPAHQPMIANTAIELQNPANTNYIRPLEEGKPGEPYNDKNVANIRQLLANYKNTIQQIKPLPYAGTGGGPAVEVTFKNADSKDDADNPTKTPIHSPVVIDVNPATKSPALQYNLQYSGNSEYGDMVKGRIYEANPVQSAHGYKPTITPIEQDESGRYKGVAITGTYSYVDKNTGAMVQKNIADEMRATHGTNVFNFANQSAKQIMDAVNKEFMNTLNQSISNATEYRKKHPGYPPYRILEQPLQNQH